jgi:hypothetical protein
MTPRILLLSAFGVAAAGCAGLQEKAVQPCNAGVCKVTVTVADCYAWDGIKADPDWLVVDSPDRTPKRIEWDIGPADYAFANNGIVITWDPKREFDEPTRTANGKKFSLRDRHLTLDKFKYTINVERNGVGCRPYDPWIKNQ